MKKREKKFNLSKNLKKTFKNKKITDEQKVSLMIKDFYFYYKNQLNDETAFCTYELYYENFMIDDNHKHNLIYKKYFDYEYYNYMYLYTVELNNYFKDLTVNSSKLSNKEQVIYKQIASLTQTCGFTNGFDYIKFYSNDALRENVVNQLKKLEGNLNALTSENKSDNLFGF